MIFELKTPQNNNLENKKKSISKTLFWKRSLQKKNNKQTKFRIMFEYIKNTS